MKNYSYRLFWSNDDDCYVATVPEFPSLSGLGATAVEALAELHVALDAALEIHHEEGWPVPEPKSLQAYSGQFRLRLAKSVHARLSERAEAEGISLNSLASTYVVQGLAGDEVLDAVRQASEELAVYRSVMRSVTDAFEQLSSGAETAVVLGLAPASEATPGINETFTARGTVQAYAMPH